MFVDGGAHREILSVSLAYRALTVTRKQWTQLVFPVEHSIIETGRTSWPAQLPSTPAARGPVTLWRHIAASDTLRRAIDVLTQAVAKAVASASDETG
jgi:hypothetical protein